MRSRKPFTRPPLLLVAGLLFLAGGIWPHPSLAQTGGTSRISGTVQDSSRAVIPGATVEVRNDGTGLVRTLSTDERGSYVAPNLPVGTYTVTVSIQGFKTFVREG